MSLSPDWRNVDAWFDSIPLWVIALALFGAMSAAAYIALRLREHRDRSRASTAGETEAHEGYIVSATLGLLALLMGFTFSLAVQRFEERRQLVLEEARAIGSAYYCAQLLEEPYRDRTSKLLLRYLNNRIALARLEPGPRQTELLSLNDALIADFEDAAGASFETIKTLDWSSTYVESTTRISELDLARKVLRAARVPVAVFGVLSLYMVTSALVLGYVLRGRVERLAAGALLVLLTVALVLIIDIDRPTGGGIVENQLPMELLQKKLLARAAARGPGDQTPSQKTFPPGASGLTGQ